MAATTHAPETMTATPMAPPSAPMLSQKPGAPVQSPIPDPDDIADPSVPAAVLDAATAPLPPSSSQFHEHEALLVGFCSVLQERVKAFMLEEHKGLMHTLDATLVAMRKWVETVGQQNEHAQYQFSDTLLKLQEQGLAVRHDPYTVQVKAVSQEGFPVTIQVAKPDVTQLTTALPALLAWLSAQGYQPVPRGNAD